MGGIDIVICLKKRNKDQKNIKKIIARQKCLNIIMNKIVFFNYAVIFSYAHANK